MGAAAMGFAYFQQKSHDEEINNLKATLKLVEKKQDEQDEIGKRQRCKSQVIRKVPGLV